MLVFSPMARWSTLTRIARHERARKSQVLRHHTKQFWRTLSLREESRRILQLPGQHATGGKASSIRAFHSTGDDDCTIRATFGGVNPCAGVWLRPPTKASHKQEGYRRNSSKSIIPNCRETGKFSSCSFGRNAAKAPKASQPADCSREVLRPDSPRARDLIRGDPPVPPLRHARADHLCDKLEVLFMP